MTMKSKLSAEQLLKENEELKERLEQAEQLIDAIKAGEVDAFALTQNDRSEIFTLQTGDYAYRALVENFQEGALNLSEEGLIVYSNNHFAKLLGTTYDKVIGQPIFSFIHPDSSSYFDGMFRKSLSGNCRGEISLVGADGREVHVYASLTSLQPTLSTVGMIATDLTEKERQEKILEQKNLELLSSEEKFNRLFFLSPVSIALSDVRTGRLIMINDHFVRTFGYAREDIIGKTALEIGLTKNQDAREDIVTDMSAHGSIRNRETELFRKSGEVVSVLMSAELIRIGNNEYYLGAHNDITDRKKSEQALARSNAELQKLNKELQSFAYISSHDLQEPLRKIQTFATRILEQEHQNLSNAGKEQFQRMQVAARRMQTLIDDLLAYTRANLTDDTFKKTDLKRIIDEVKEDLKEDLVEKRATIDSTELCDASVIPFQFRQLMHNLIGNSLKFSSPGQPPHIKIRSEIERGTKLDGAGLEPQATYCHISVSDNGIGFEPQYREKIFEVFQRLHPKATYNGTGIGLAIVKKIVENHRGIITANSKPNKGATFDIYLPVNGQHSN
jgi:PAS domain S-box-containing protein